MNLVGNMEKYFEFESLPKQARENLIQLADKVMGVNPIEIESIRVLTSRLKIPTEEKVLIDKISTKFQNGNSYIYYIRVIKGPNLQKMEQVFLSAKETKPIAYPRINGLSKFLYVGSSSNLVQRFKEHLGYGSSKTYSLQLARWAGNLDIELEFIYAQYDTNVSQDVIQIIEDTLWDSLKPMFGRKGKR